VCQERLGRNIDVFVDFGQRAAAIDIDEAFAIISSTAYFCFVEYLID